MPFLILPILWIATALGRRVNAAVLGAAASTSSALERCIFGAATGLCLISYGILVIGLLRLLNPAPIGALFGFAAVLGWREHVALAKVIGRTAQVCPTVFGVVTGLVFLYFAVVSLVGCFTPPSPLEWDSMSYHLADPAIYIKQHRILYLPWESHSNFAFTMEMLYAVGLMCHSIPLAKLFHFTMGALAALAIYQTGRRHFDSRTGVIGALLFVSMPLVFWEAGTAYVDLAAASFGALALLALVNAIRLDQPRWLALAAVMLGWMVSVKATSIVTVTLYALVAAAWMGWRARSDRAASPMRLATKILFAIGVAAVVIGSPWYIKSWIYTGNPVYPFAYSIFGGRYFTADNAAQYTAAQNQFGLSHMDPDAQIPRGAELFMAPYSLTMFTMIDHNPPGHERGGSFKGNPFNDIENAYVSLSPFFLAVMFIPAFRKRRAPGVVRMLGTVSLASLFIWFFMTQQERYFLPTIPLLCLFGAYYYVRALSERRIVGYSLSALLVAGFLYSGWIGMFIVRRNLPPAAGTMSVRNYEMQSGFYSYAAFDYLNNLPDGSNVVLYGEPMGFYCRQSYMWGEPGHSTVIPYDRCATAEDLRAYFKSIGVKYLLVNYGEFRYTGDGSAHWAQMVWELTRDPSNPPVYVVPAPHGGIAVEVVKL